ncbi:tRNA (adenosine(37)-N6)-threonylcarbamoyltransferase complex dimerization subunit type 1 TsaB [Nesterenkonia muleiensis]|uniref:tRNA (adenosine(37)-N6)-threonylcarbamoyltransferase complex dimerization subunit type 1 TsaB n=1 Tax=Nesterenkonia muleiensis TaxID=2282648 RepID=UPI000E750E35|nr:tRNA (adenosine(37)-N6)-threonylcarbamoyltransferase complex dimerization subunit type 1 TsaB [Nesterenkonia muleiensis]
MLLLSIDSSAGASAALTGDGEPLSSWQTEQTTSHAEVLAPAVHQLISEASVTGEELGGVVVGAGPGPFTGLRVGLALAHALAEAWDKPLYGVCSLDSLALRATDAGIAGEFLVTTDARRREVYWARYESDDVGSRLIEGPFVGPAAELPALPAVGSGVQLYPQDLSVPELLPDAAAWLPDAAELGRLAHGAVTGELTGVLCPPLPLYLRGSDAKVPQQMLKGAAS